MLEVVSVAPPPAVMGYAGADCMHPLAMTLAINLRRARCRLRLTTEELAKSVDLTVEEYERIERGNFPSSPKVFLDLVVTLGVPADELLIALSPPQLRVIRGGKSPDPSPPPKESIAPRPRR